MWSLLRGPGLGGWKKQWTEHHGTQAVCWEPRVCYLVYLTIAHSTERKTEAQRG